MSTRMILSIAFALFVVLGMLVYITQDNRRAATTNGNVIEEEAHAGAELFGANCSQCHGPKGEGAIGPALDREEWRADNAKYDENSVRLFLRNVLQRGQHSPQPGIQMPAWAKEYGGPFNEQQIDDLIRFITNGDWNLTLRYTAAPNFLADIPPNELQKKQYPTITSVVLAAKNPQKYGADDTRTAEQKKLLNADAKQEDAAKGPIFQEVEKNKETLRKLLGNRDPANPSEKLSGMRQLLMVKGCMNCHGFGSAGTTLGPSLTEVGSRRTSEWLYTWIKDPSAVSADKRGPNIQPWFAEDKRTEFWPMGPTFMPTIQMTDMERQMIVDYIANLKTPTVAAPKAPAAPGSN